MRQLTRSLLTAYRLCRLRLHRHLVLAHRARLQRQTAFTVKRDYYAQARERRY
jgi:hypothetical protein